jgi:hypothetical protein
MELSDKQLKFIHRRRKLISFRKYVVLFLSILFVAFLGWMYHRAPLLVNPYEVMSRVESSSLDKNTMILMAGMLPIIVLLALFLLGALIIFFFIAMSNEARYIEIIDQIIDDKQDKPEKT